MSAPIFRRLPSPARPAFLIALLGACALLGTAQPAGAVGTEVTRRDRDIQLTVDSRWAGGALGGYHPVRIRAVNRGPACVLLFRFSTGSRSYSVPLPNVERAIQIEQNAAVNLTLSIPLVSSGSSGMLEVYQNGRKADGLTSTIPLAESGQQERVRSSLLVITDEPTVNCTFFNEAAAALSQNQILLQNSYYGRYGGSGGIRAEDHQVLPPSLLPSSWLDYSAVDLVAIPLPIFVKVPADTREAILNWVETGGTLIVYNVGQTPQESPELARLLKLAEYGPGGAKWTDADVNQRRTIQAYKDESGSMSYTTTPTTPALPQPVQEPFIRTGQPIPFAHADLLLGRVYAFTGSPFPGSRDDWGWLLNSASPQRTQWNVRTGITTRIPMNEFSSFKIPGVGDAPVIAFLVMISLFTLLIGPLNYIFVWRRRQLYLLVGTIPLIAFATTVFLFAYAAMADGFGVKSRVLSLTYLDQPSRHAVAMNRISLFAGLAPSAGMTFQPQTAVYPIWARQNAFESGRLDWTNNDQRMTGGWLRSRTRTQFATINHRTERGRLEVGEPQGGNLSVSNGLAWDLPLLVVRAADGKLYLGDNVPAGATATLREVPTQKATSAFATAFEGKLPVPANDTSYNGGLWGGGYYSQGNSEANVPFMQGTMMRRVMGLRRLQEADLPAGQYAAVCAENPGSDVGLKGAREIGSLHLLMGRY